jgi:hypothetical protein
MPVNPESILFRCYSICSFHAGSHDASFFLLIMQLAACAQQRMPYCLFHHVIQLAFFIVRRKTGVNGLKMTVDHEKLTLNFIKGQPN